MSVRKSMLKIQAGDVPCFSVELGHLFPLFEGAGQIVTVKTIECII